MNGTRRWRWWVAGLLAILAGLAVAGERSMARVWSFREETQRVQREIQGLEAENEDLARTAERLRDDPEVIEQIAREELGMVRPGEKVLRFPKR
jgi:cell division protein FtsB